MYLVVAIRLIQPAITLSFQVRFVCVEIPMEKHFFVHFLRFLRRLLLFTTTYCFQFFTTPVTFSSELIVGLKLVGVTPLSSSSSRQGGLYRSGGLHRSASLIKLACLCPRDMHGVLRIIGDQDSFRWRLVCVCRLHWLSKS